MLVSLLLAACSGQASNDVDHGLDAVEDNAAATWTKARNISGFPQRQPKPKPPVTQARYCYKALEDILCYGEPLPGAADRLVAYQGSAGQTGYVLVERKHHKNKEDSSGEIQLIPEVPNTSAPLAPAAEPQPATGNPKKLKEIFFDPEELQPKELVPQKSE